MKLKHFPPLLVAGGAFLDLYVSYKLADENEITAIVDCRPYMLDEHAQSESVLVLVTADEAGDD